MKRLLALLVLLALLPAAVLCEETFAYTSARDARRKALAVFRVCAFTSEYGGDTARGSLIRWDEPILVFAAGTPDDEDLAELDGFLTELSLRVPLMPRLLRVDSEDRANMVIHFCPLAEMKTRIPNYTSGNLGYFSYYTAENVINRAVIGIAVDMCGRTVRNHLMREEIVGALGLANDHNVYADSILYQSWTTVQTLSEVDWIMLNMLYCPLVHPGDDWEAADRAFRAFYGL